MTGHDTIRNTPQTTSVGETIHRLLHAYRRALREAHRAGGVELTVTEIRVLKGFDRFGSRTAHDISNAMRLDKAQVTRLVRSLTAAGMIETHPDPADRRRHCLSLTATGKASMQRIFAIEKKAGDRMAQGLATADIHDFQRVAGAMIHNLTEQEQSPCQKARHTNSTS